VIDVNPSTGACSRSPTGTADACVSVPVRSVLPYTLFYMFIYLLFIYLLSNSYAHWKIIMMMMIMIILIVVRIKCNKAE